MSSKHGTLSGLKNYSTT